MTTGGIGDAATTLTGTQVDRFVAERLADENLDGQRVCLIVPDGTRSCPLPLLLDAVYAALAGRVRALTILVALGTHAGLDDAALTDLLGGEAADRYPDATVANHRWWEPDQLVSLGQLDADTLAGLSGGRLAAPVEVTINRAAVEHDTLLIVGPVFPHEVVGFSGGNKYLFPGISGPHVIDVSHWLGALIGSAAIIGTTGTTPVRALIDAAAALVPARRRALSAVVTADGRALHALTYGSPEASWAAAVPTAAASHIRYLDAPVRRVLSILPARYDELWTGAKGMYKVEPIVADGGEVVIYAPHLCTVSHTHDAAVRAIGYHTRDYFTGQWGRFADHPWGVLAHSTHLRGTGTWDATGGEHPRICVTLATGIDRATTEELGLSYLDPATVDVAACRTDPNTLVVPDAGEVLYRLRG